MKKNCVLLAAGAVVGVLGTLLATNPNVREKAVECVDLAASAVANLADAVLKPEDAFEEALKDLDV